MEGNRCPRTLTLQLDFDKSLRTPKVTAQDTYYSTRLKTHLLGIYCANEKSIYCFLYDETTGSTGPNEVISLLDYLLQRLEIELGKHDHLIIWSDNAPGQFKECFLFFYLDYIVQQKRFIRADFKFLLEGHTYSVCDRRFGTVQTLFKRREVIATPRQWATVLEESGLANVKVCWVTLDMIKNFKCFLRLRYVSRNEDIGKVRFEVKNIAWLNFGYGEEIGDNQELQLVHHPDIVFIRFQMNPKEIPRRISFVKKKQATDLKPEFLTVLRQQRRPVREDVKNSCVRLAQKYLSINAVRFYQSLPSTQEECDDDEMQ